MNKRGKKVIKTFDSPHLLIDVITCETHRTDSEV